MAPPTNFLTGKIKTNKAPEKAVARTPGTTPQHQGRNLFLLGRKKRIVDISKEFSREQRDISNTKVNKPGGLDLNIILIIYTICKQGGTHGS